jgi:hypothetical protein
MAQIPNQFVRGQRFNPTAADANRLLKVAREADQGAANLTAAEIRTALQLGHIFIKNNTGSTLERFSVVGLGDRLYPFRLNENRLDITLNAWNGDTVNVKRHWYHFGVTQQKCAAGEIVRAAIDGPTFVRMTGGASPSATGPLSNMALTTGTALQPSAYGHHAKLLAPADTNSQSSTNPGLVQLGHYSRVWACIVESRTDGDTLVGYIELYGDGSNKQQINIEDDYDLLPSTTDLPTGAVDAWRVAVEISQGDNDSDILGRLLTIPREWAMLGVEMSVPPL